MIKRLLLLTYILAFLSCGKNAGDTDYTYIGGEIVNPKQDYVVISKGSCAIDTVALNDDNFFLFKGKDLPEGLYTFQHNEYQVFYLEPGDSLMLRVNTVDFDESLTFSGTGAARNNLLIDMFLINEAEDQQMPPMYLLTPNNFEAKIDSFKHVRTYRYNQFLENHTPPKGYRSLMEANITYDLYSRKELYTSANANNAIFDNPDYVPETFYAYRETVDFGKEDLFYHYSYYRYLNRLFDNYSFKRYKGETYFNRKSFVHNYHKIAIIDSLIANDSLKNSLVRNNVRRYLVNAKKEENERKMVERFKEISSNKKHHKEIEKLADATIRLTPNHTIPNLKVLTTNNTVKDLHSTIRKPTVLYFWSSSSIKHYKNIHSRASELHSKYPEYDFIGINTDTHFRKWRNIVKAAGYDNQREFQFENIDDAQHKLVINSVNKAFVIDGNGKILEGNTNLFDRSIENQLLGFLNQ